MQSGFLSLGLSERATSAPLMSAAYESLPCMTCVAIQENSLQPAYAAAEHWGGTARHGHCKAKGIVDTVASFQRSFCCVHCTSMEHCSAFHCQIDR